MICPICDSPATRSKDNPHGPFCSKRCKLIDLSKWFGGEYSIAGTSTMAEREATMTDAPDESHTEPPDDFFR